MTRSLHDWLSACVVALLLLWPTPSKGQSQTLTEAQAMRRALDRAPSVQAARSALVSHGAVERSAGGALPTPPRVELAAGARRQRLGDTSLEVSLGVWQDVSLAGLGGARRNHARALTAESRAQLEVVRRETAARAALAWVDARAARELLTLLEGSEKDAAELERIVSARVEVGRSPPSELALARSIRGRARADVLAAEGRLHVAEVRLRVLTGLPPTTAIVLRGPLALPQDRDALDENALVGRSTTANPRLALAAAAPRSDEAAARALLAAGSSPLSVGPSVTREGTGDFIILGRVSIPLPTTNPATFEAARLRAQAASGRAEVSRVRSELELATRLAFHERYHARDTRDALWKGAVLPAREALDEATKRYQAGEADLSLVLGARRELSSAQEKWTEASAEVRRADIELWQHTGQPRRLDRGWSP